MKIMTSYFYQIRFMKPNYIPLSTALWDPKWFHQNQKQDYQWKDKNGVWNGLRAEPFAPGPLCENLCRGPESCGSKDPKQCEFLRVYLNQLRHLDFTNIMMRFQMLANSVQEAEGFTEEPIVVLIFHEKYDNPCSERWAVQQWFKENGMEIKEFNKEII